MNIVFVAILFVIGIILGSFICCQAQRLRLREKGKKDLGNRSVCLSCKYRLKWYDNIPIISWVVLRGKCRKCGSAIGVTEILSEVLMGLAFLFVGISFGDVAEMTTYDWIYLIFMLAFIVILGFLAIYDGKWGELPQNVLVAAVVVGFMNAVYVIVSDYLVFNSSMILNDRFLSLLGGVGILAGVYFLLYFFSKGKMVGDGDWILGLAISLCLSNWWLALVTMFLSNFLAAIIMIPQIKTKKNKKIYFGPWMIFAFVLTFIFRSFLLSLVVF